MNSFKVSVIIPTYNEQEHIRTCLESLSAQTITNMELIVVDDGSTDDTCQIVESFASIILLKQEHRGPGTARNLGASKSRSKILVFVDADMTFESDFLERPIDPIISGESIGTFSKEEYVANMDNSWARAWSLLRGFEDGRMHPKDSPKTQKVFRAILKNKFESVGGFDQTRGYDDDWSLSERLGEEATEAENAKFYHHNPSSLPEIFTQAKWGAKRKYKLGYLGKLVGLLRASWPVSLLVGLAKMVRHSNRHMFIIQIVYDLGISVGILEELLVGKTAK